MADTKRDLAHIGLWIVAAGAWVGVVFGIYYFTAQAVRNGTYFTQTEVDAAVTGARATRVFGTLAWSFITLGPIGLRVGYRWRDVFMILIPIYGLFVHMPKMMWRWTGLAVGETYAPRPDVAKREQLASPPPTLPPPPPEPFRPYWAKDE